MLVKNEPIEKRNINVTGESVINDKMVARFTGSYWDEVSSLTFNVNIKNRQLTAEEKNILKTDMIQFFDNLIGSVAE